MLVEVLADGPQDVGCRGRGEPEDSAPHLYHVRCRHLHRRCGTVRNDRAT